MIESSRGIELGPPKTAESARTITLPPFLIRLLRAHLDRHDHPHVFTSHRGEPHRRSNFGRRALRPATEGTGYLAAPPVRLEPVKPGLTFHGLRHSHKTWMIADGVPEVAQSRRLGHILGDRIQETYSHVAAEVEHRLLDGLQRPLGQSRRRQPRPTRVAEMTPPAFSPTFAQRCPQKWFNPILLGFARRQDSVTILLQWRVDTLIQDDDQVQVHVRSTTSDEEQTFTGRYLVACDGARSNIRRDLGIATVKSSVWGTSAEVIIESPEMKAIPLAQTLGVTLVEATGMALSLLPFDGRDQYRITWMVGDGEITQDDMRDAAPRIAGTDVAIEFKHDILPWSNRETTATTFRAGRVFLAGDAAHTMPTTGGLGMNTGITGLVRPGPRPRSWCMRSTPRDLVEV